MSRIQHDKRMLKKKYHAGLSTKVSFIVFVCLLLSLFIFSPVLEKTAECVEVGNVTVVIENGTIKVSSDLILDQSHISDMNDGLQKEFIFFVDLFREWKIWPDEFILGTKLSRKIRSDSVKKEFAVITSDKASVSEQRFNSLESLLSEALKLNNIELVRTGALLSGTYFVKVTASSRTRKHAPIIGYLLFFMPENEFSVEKISGKFVIPEK